MEKLARQPVYDHVKAKSLKQDLKREEEFWRCQSRVQWLQAGDKKTSSFHALCVQSRRHNQIRGLVFMTVVCGRRFAVNRHFCFLFVYHD